MDIRIVNSYSVELIERNNIMNKLLCIAVVGFGIGTAYAQPTWRVINKTGILQRIDKACKGKKGAWMPIASDDSIEIALNGTSSSENRADLKIRKKEGADWKEFPELHPAQGAATPIPNNGGKKLEIKITKITDCWVRYQIEES